MSKATLTAAETYRRALAEASAVYKIAWAIAFKEQSDSHKALEDAFDRATAAVDVAFDSAQEAASGVCDRATAAADAAFAAVKPGIPI